MNAIAAGDTAVTHVRRSRRHIVFPVLAILFALLGWVMLDGIVEALSPWWLLVDYDPTPEIHRWYYAEHGARIALLLSGSLAVLAWRPAGKPLLLQFYALGWVAMTIGFSILGGTSDLVVNLVFAASAFVLVALLAFAYPVRGALFDFSRDEPFSRPLLAATISMAVVLVPLIVIRAHDQLTAAGDPGDIRGGSSGVALNLMLIAAGLLTASKRPGWKSLGLILGTTLIYLGIAALSIPDQMDSWGTGGGVLALAAGIGFIALTIRESRLPATDNEAE